LHKKTKLKARQKMQTGSNTAYVNNVVYNHARYWSLDQRRGCL